jgi:chemotaxis signal transduction protein
VDDHPTLTANSARPTRRPWCLFQSGTRTYAVALEAVAEVVEVERLVCLPQSPPQVLGLCTLRREVIPVIELDRSARDGKTPGAGSRLTVLVLKTGRGRWAIQVNSEGTTVAEEELGDPPLATAPADGPSLGISGTVRRGDAVYSVIDPEATWKFVRHRVEDWYSNHWARESSPNSAAGIACAGSDATPAPLLEVRT